MASYVIGIQLSENYKEVTPELHLTSVDPTLVNHRSAVVASLQNSRPVLVENTSFQAQVFEENGTEPIKEVQQDNINMAPNSNIDVIIDWENEPLAEGVLRFGTSGE